MTAALSLTLAAIARAMRLSRGRSKGFVGVERQWVVVGMSWLSMIYQLIPDLVEGRERCAAGDDGLEMIIQLVQPLKNVEDDIAIRDYIVEVSQGVGHALHLATVVTHRELTLDEVAECGIEVKCPHFAIDDKLVLEHELDLACGDVALLGDVLKLTGDSVEDPGDQDALHALPSRVVDRGHQRERDR
jgi:hypothetical protein